MPAPRGVFAGLVSVLISVAALAATASAGYAVTPVSWPPSMGLVLAEVVTGGVSASDEYVEIANAASVPLDLSGLELIYVTASGSTVTRKVSFASPLPLVPGGHILLANGAGIFGPLADVTYSGGLAADGGSVALRDADGEVVDAVGWGNATNSFVEGSPAPAPAARSSIERRPGGAEGNWLDTNDNGADWLVQPNPVPQSLASAPTPVASDAPPAAPTDAASDSPTAAPSSPAPTGEPSVSASPKPGPTRTAPPPRSKESSRPGWRCSRVAEAASCRIRAAA
jgi:hypothetical protein